jgi:hypothetical protein
VQGRLGVMLLRSELKKLMYSFVIVIFIANCVLVLVFLDCDVIKKALIISGFCIYLNLIRKYKQKASIYAIFITITSVLCFCLFILVNLGNFVIYKIPVGAGFYMLTSKFYFTKVILFLAQECGKKNY